MSNHHQPGTVMVVDPDCEQIQPCRVRGDTRVVGVVAEYDGEHVDIILAGKIPVWVVGEVRRGDVLITSDVPGHAQSSAKLFREINWSMRVGRALSDKLDDQPGLVEILV